MSFQFRHISSRVLSIKRPRGQLHEGEPRMNGDQEYSEEISQDSTDENEDHGNEQTGDRGELEGTRLMRSIGHDESIEMELDRMKEADYDDGYIAGRIARQGRNECTAMTARGEVNARYSGRLKSIREGPEMPVGGTG